VSDYSALQSILASQVADSDHVTTAIPTLTTNTSKYVLLGNFGTFRHAFDLDQVLRDRGSLGNRGVAAIGNDGVVAFRQDTLRNIVGDPQLQESDLGDMGALDGECHRFLIVEIILLVAFIAKGVRLVLVIDVVDGQFRSHKGLGKLNRDRSRVLADNANSIGGIGRNARVRHQHNVVGAGLRTDRWEEAIVLINCRAIRGGRTTSRTNCSIPCRTGSANSCGTDGG